MTFDTQNNRVLMYGGGKELEGNFVLFNDMWSLDPQTYQWQELNPVGGPGNLYHYGIAYDSTNGEIIIFGGYDGVSEGGVNGNTWIFNCSTDEWTRVFPEVAPSPRSDPAMYYDPISQKIILYGGTDMGGSSTTYYSDTWAYDIIENNWSQMNPSTYPERRYGHQMVYDPVNNRGLLFGGHALSGVTNDFWTYYYSNDSWVTINTINPPDVRYWYTMNYDLVHGRVVIFGGRKSEFIGDTYLINETWTYDPHTNTWSQINSKNYPSSRTSAYTVFDPIQNNTILFGGMTGFSPLTGNDETWVLQNDEWKNVSFKGDSDVISGFTIMIVLSVIPIIIQKKKRLL
jgi:N-acetylneuraminic acid mutarotase